MKLLDKFIAAVYALVTGLRDLTEAVKSLDQRVSILDERLDSIERDLSYTKGLLSKS